MKSFLKIKFNVFFIGKYTAKGIYWLILTIVLAMAFSGCKKDMGTANLFPVNETFAKELIDEGIPADAAQFFAAARMETTSPNDTTCIFLRTFPNGATREITLRVSPDRQYTPTPDEIANTIPGSSPIYVFKYSSDIQEDGTTKTELNYFVPKADLSKGSKLMQIAKGNGATDGVAIQWEEIGKKGTDVSISSLYDFYKVGSLASIYALASALNDITTSLDLSKQYKGWKYELDALEECAANPINKIAMSDPNYSSTTVAKIQDARNELIQVTAVRFLNIIDERAMDLTPITAVLSIPAKQVFVWNEKTLENISEGGIMRECRLAVVSCDSLATLEGNVDVITEHSWPNGDSYFKHVFTNVKWVIDPRWPWNNRVMTHYISQGGNSTYFSKFIVQGCTTLENYTGSIRNTGLLWVLWDPALAEMQGWGYFMHLGAATLQGTTIDDCPITSDTYPYASIQWTPGVTGYHNSTGTIIGEQTDTVMDWITKIKWSFSVPRSK